MTTPGPHGAGSLEGRCFLSVLDFEPADLEHSLALSATLKRDRPLGKEAPTSAALQGTYVALLFEKPSLRTRSTFEIAIRELGGNFIVPSADVALGKRESLADVGRCLERWVGRSSGPHLRTVAVDGPGAGHHLVSRSSTRSATRSIPARRWPTA